MAAEDATNYGQVIAVATKEGKFADLVRYLQMARKKAREPLVESELVFSLAKTNRLSELEEFIASPNVAQIAAIGERCFEQQMYEAAKLLFTNISNYGRLATTLVHLAQYSAAVECARKANATRVWKEVHSACVAHEEFKLAHICGLQLVIHAEELDHLIKLYEHLGYIEPLLQLLEASLVLERAHMGMFTELAILYAKYKVEKLMDHLKLYANRINIPKVIRVVEAAQEWKELVFLYVQYDEFDNAALTIMKQSVDAWEHASFKDVLLKVANLEILYKVLLR